MSNFLDSDIEINRTNDKNAPSTKAAGDYTDKQCGVVIDYMQTTFADNIMVLVADKYGPHIIYDDPSGFEASNSNAGATWHLTGLDLSPYKRIKCYVCEAGDANSNYTPSHIVEIHLDDRAKGSFGYFVGGHGSQNPNNNNRIHFVQFVKSGNVTFHPARLLKNRFFGKLGITAHPTNRY